MRRVETGTKTMAHRYFEGKVHAAMYAKYRPIPPTKLIERMVSFIKEKVSFMPATFMHLVSNLSIS